MAVLYEKIMEGDYDRDFVDAVKGWVVEKIGAAGEDRDSNPGYSRRSAFVSIK